MSFGISTGLPVVTAAQRLGMFLPNKPEIPIKFDAGNPSNTEIDRQLPVQSLDCRLSGSATAGTAFAAPVNGAMDLIRELELVLNGDSKLVRLPGFYLPWLDVFENGGSRPAYSDVSAGSGAKPFDIGFSIPIDIGSYQSLLDATRENELTLDVKWGDADDIAAGGAGTSVVDSGTKIEVDTNSVARGGNGQRGGIGYGYWRRFLNFRRIPINATTNDERIKLGTGKQFSSLTFLSFDNGVWSDDILNAVKIKIGTTDVRSVSAGRLRVKNMRQYNLDDTELLGLHRLDIANENHPEQLLSVFGSQEMELTLDVTAGTNAEVYVIEDYIREPVAAG